MVSFAYASHIEAPVFIWDGFITSQILPAVYLTMALLDHKTDF